MQVEGVGGCKTAMGCSLLKQGGLVCRSTSSEPPLSWPALTCSEVELLLAGQQRTGKSPGEAQDCGFGGEAPLLLAGLG